MAEQAASEFGRYKLLEKIGRDNLSDIFKATDTETGRTVVLKVLNSVVSSNARFARFFGDRDALIAQQVEHPNILALLDCGKVGARYYVAFEYAQGTSLARRLDEGPVPTEQGIEILRQVCEALRAAHKKQVIHGDIKTANIILTRDRRNQLLVKVAFVDLALATADATVSVFGEVLGTPKYMSPEQIKGKAPDEQSDIFSLGIVAYEMFCGREPFHAERPVGYLFRNVLEEAVPIHELDAKLPREISLIVEKMMAKETSQRYLNCQHLLEDLDQAEQRTLGQFVKSIPEGADSAFARKLAERPRVEQPVKRIPKKRILTVAGVAGLVVIVGVLLAVVFTSRGEIWKKADELIFSKLRASGPEQTSEADSLKTERENEANKLLARAKILENERRYEEARLLYEEIERDYPDTGAADEARDASLALQRLVSERARRGKSPEEVLEIIAEEARSDVNRNDYATAIRRYRDFCLRFAASGLAAQVQQERLPSLLKLWAEFAVQQHDFSTAASKYEELAKEYSDTAFGYDARQKIADVLLQWGKSLYQDAEYERAMETLEKLKREYPAATATQEASKLLPEVCLRGAEARVEAGDLDRAVAAYRELMIKYEGTQWAEKAKVQLPEVVLKRAEALLEAGQREQALASFEEIMDAMKGEPIAVKAAERHAAALRQWCEELIENGRIEEAVLAYDAYVASHPAEKWMPCSKTDLGQYRKLVAKYKPEAEAAKQRVDMPLILYMEGKENADAGDYEEAVDMLESLVEDYPDSRWAKRVLPLLPELRYECGQNLIAGGKTEKGMQILEELTKKYPDTEWAKKASEGAKYAADIPPGMVFIPGGEFIMGSKEEEIPVLVRGEEGVSTDSFLNETPQRRVRVAPFYLDIHEVTNDEYRRFIEATKRQPPANWFRGRFIPGRENYPVSFISHEDAKAYAEWVGKRLPTEAEWELAARGTDGRLYPWGNDFEMDKCNIVSRRVMAAKPVGSYPAGASPFGCLDMIGNVAEWAADRYRPYPGNKHEDPRYGNDYGVVRGGSWETKLPVMARCAVRVPLRADEMGPALRSIGLRCAKSVE